MDISSKQKITKGTLVLNDTFSEMDLIDLFRTIHPNAEEHTFSTVHGTFYRIDHILGHKSNLNKFKKIDIISSIFLTKCCETRYKLQEKNCKKHKHMEFKQHASK